MGPRLCFFIRIMQRDMYVTVRLSQVTAVQLFSPIKRAKKILCRMKNIKALAVLCREQLLLGRRKLHNTGIYFINFLASSDAFFSFL